MTTFVYITTSMAYIFNYAFFYMRGISIATLKVLNMIEIVINALIKILLFNILLFFLIVYEIESIEILFKRNTKVALNCGLYSICTEMMLLIFLVKVLVRFLYGEVLTNLFIIQ